MRLLHNNKVLLKKKKTHCGPNPGKRWKEAWSIFCIYQSSTFKVDRFPLLWFFFFLICLFLCAAIKCYFQE